MGKVSEMEKALNEISDGMTLMVGGFMAVGSPENIIDSLVKRDIKDLTIICNDAGLPDLGVGKLISNGQVKKLIASHIGLNPVAGQLMAEGKLDVLLTPQGTLIEQIRSGGAGLGGVLTQTGLGTTVEAGKNVVEVDGKLFLLEKPLKADVALIRGSKVDKAGNIIYNYTTRNFNPVMATAANKVIVEAEEIVEVGTLHADSIVTPSIFVDYIVKGE